MKGRAEPLCRARWWSPRSRSIIACGKAPVPGFQRCAKHGPDGSRLTSEGVPVTPETRAQRMAAAGAKRG